MWLMICFVTWTVENTEDIYLVQVSRNLNIEEIGCSFVFAHIFRQGLPVL